MVSKTELKRRWLNLAEDSPLIRDVASFLETGDLGRKVDLRGAQIALDGPLAEFRLIGGRYRNADLSFGKGCLVVHDASVEDVLATRFSFDRASRIISSRICRADFSFSRFKVSSTDSEYSACDFSQTQFRGGFNEYGFTRCTFLGCSFSGIDWKNMYFRACEFRDCNWEGASISKSIIAGMKLFGFGEWPEILHDCEIVSLFVDGEKVIPRPD